jgi:hypothetical protein
VFNAEGRRAAGLDADFIRSLEVYARSRGRTPGVFVFNPFSGASIESSVNPSVGRSPANPRSAGLHRGPRGWCQFLGRRDDVALVPSLPSPAHQAELQRAGFPVIEFIALSDGKIPLHSDLRDRKLGALRPWCWGPDSVELLESICPPGHRRRSAAGVAFSSGHRRTAFQIVERRVSVGRGWNGRPIDEPSDRPSAAFRCVGRTPESPCVPFLMHWNSSDREPPRRRIGWW